MNNTDIILTVLGSIGMTFIITQSFLFKGIRLFVIGLKNDYLTKLVCCTACVGFHSGWINVLGVLFVPYFWIFQIACITSISSYTVWLLLKGLMNKYDA